MNFMTKSLFLFFAFFIASTHCLVIDVGGKKGWILHPPVAYDVWAQKMRFSVGDILDFKYNKAIDSVMVVSKDDYEKCSSESPMAKLDDGASPYKFEKSGPYYFISGNKTHCDQGQKFHLIVLTVRNGSQPPVSSPPAPDTSAAPPPSGTDITISPPVAVDGISPPPGASTSSTPADLNASPPMPSSARPAFSVASTATLVMISLGLVGLIGSA